MLCPGNPHAHNRNDLAMGVASIVSRNKHPLAF